MSVRLARAAIQAVAVLLIAVPLVVAYDGEPAGQVVVEGPARAVCPATVGATATVVDGNGNPIQGATVTWSTGDVGTTDASGRHSITLNVGSTVEVTATSSGTVGRLTVTCVAAGGEVLGSVGLPRTDTATDGGPSPAGLLALLVAAILAVPLVVLARRPAPTR